MANKKTRLVFLYFPTDGSREIVTISVTNRVFSGLGAVQKINNKNK